MIKTFEKLYLIGAVFTFAFFLGYGQQKVSFLDFVGLVLFSAAWPFTFGIFLGALGSLYFPFK